MGGNSTYGATNNLEDATKLFKFGADNTEVEWKLDAYSNQGDNSFVIITDHKAKSVEGGSWAAKQISKDKGVTLGEKVVDIHSHPGTESKGASTTDQTNINAPNNAVYLKKDATLYEYNQKSNNLNNRPIKTWKDLKEYVKSKLF